MNLRAMAAIVQARLRAERRIILYACVTAALAGFSNSQTLLVPIVFCSALGIATALLQGPGRHIWLDLCEQSAPLFGRELARAKAAAPCIVTMLATAIYSSTSAIVDPAEAPLVFLAALGASVSATMVTLSATIRTGAQRALYVAIACMTALTAYLIAGTGNSLYGELAFCALVAFWALRQFGEALARYDPVENYTG